MDIQNKLRYSEKAKNRSQRLQNVSFAVKFGSGEDRGSESTEIGQEFPDVASGKRIGLRHPQSTGSSEK